MAGIGVRVIWLKHGDQLFPVQTDPEGRLQIRQLAARLGLDADTVELDGLQWSCDPQGTTFLPVLGGGDRAEAINVTGQASAASSVEQGLLQMKSYLEEQERARQEQERVREAQYERDRDFIFRTLARIETRRRRRLARPGKALVPDFSTILQQDEDCE